MKVLIIIPAYNEAENIERVITELCQKELGCDYLIVNDGSTDGTNLICREKGYPLLDLPVNLGLSGAFRAGMRYARRYGYDAALQLDGDGQHDPVYIAPMIEAMQRSASDIVIGSRFVREKRRFSLRMLGNRMISFAIRLTTGQRITDPTSGMRLYNEKMIRLFATQDALDPEPDTICYLIRCGISVREVPVTMRERVAGTSYLSMGRSIRYMAETFISILFIQFFRRRS